MNKLISSLALAAAFALAGVAIAPSAAEAQCVYGCACQGGACGCNSNGTGDGCTASGEGCVVSTCDDTTIQSVAFAPDGSVVQFASETEGEGANVTSADGVRSLRAQLSGSTRWEYVSAGLSVARNCSGLIVARVYDRQAAAAIRQKDRTLTI